MPPGLGRLQLRLFAPLPGPPRPGGGLSLRRWHPGGRRGATTGGNHGETMGKPWEKCWKMWENYGKYGKTMGKNMGKCGKTMEHVGKPWEKTWENVGKLWNMWENHGTNVGWWDVFIYFCFMGNLLEKVYGKSMEHGDFTSKHWHLTKKKCSSTCKSWDNLTKLQGIMVVSDKKRGLTSKSRAVTNKRGTSWDFISKKMLAGNGCKI